MKLYLVYLAGPISGCTFEGCTDWRSQVQRMFPDHVVGLSPMRQKEYLKDATAIADDYPETVLSSQRGITTRDRWDAMRCDALFVNLLGATRVSIGTVMEMAWADAKRIPIVLVMEKEGNLHDHAMLREVVGFRVPDLDEGVEVIKAMFYHQ
jgi:nucleoside 2-deoxyribosyltransferase